MTAHLIAFEGSDGAGKATQTDMLVEYLMRQGKKVERVSFPRYNITFGGTLLYDVMKGDRAEKYNFPKVDPYVASMLYAMDRKESETYLNELIKNNDVVVFDRYVESNLLHQGGKFSSENERVIFAEWLFGLEYDLLKLPKPHEIVYLAIPFWLSLKRSQLRQDNGGAKLDTVEKDIDYVKAGHEAGIFYAKHFQWNIVEGMKDKKELSVDDVHSQVKIALGY